MRDPYTDLEINCRSQLTLLEACRHHNPGTKVVFAGTRQVYGRPDALPVDRAAPGAADRRQRHQQGRRRVLPPRLQQRVRRARLLAAPDQRLRPAPAASATTARASSAGSSAWRSRTARSRSSATARRSATSSTSTMRPTRSCAPAPPTRSTARSSTSAATSTSSHRDLVALLVALRRQRLVPLRRVAGREEGDRHRQLLRRLVEVHARHRLDAGGPAARGARSARWRSIGRTTPRTSCPKRVVRSARPGADVVTATRSAFPSTCCARARTRAAIDAAIDRVIDSGWFVLGPEVGGVRSRVRRRQPAPRTPSASAPAPTPSR